LSRRRSSEHGDYLAIDHLELRPPLFRRAITGQLGGAPGVMREIGTIGEI